MQEVKKVVEAIYNSTDKPERVTIGAVGRRIGNISITKTVA